MSDTESALVEAINAAVSAVVRGYLSADERAALEESERCLDAAYQCFDEIDWRERIHGQILTSGVLVYRIGERDDDSEAATAEEALTSGAGSGPRSKRGRRATVRRSDADLFAA